MALADFVVSAALTAVTENVAGEGTPFGALYSPLVLMVPNVEFPPVTPFTFHVTDLFVALVTVAVNCLVFLTRMLAMVGEMLMPTGGGGGGGCGLVTVIDALPMADGVTALLVACTVTVAGVGGVRGAL